MTTAQYDVAVVGAGPAGGVTAYHLASRGMRVILLERERLPRYKVCGGGVTRKALQSLPFSVEDVLECAPTTAVMVAHSSSPIRFDTGEVIAHTVMRDRFDARIVNEAARVGAEVRDGVKVLGVSERRVITASGDIRARVIVGADGAPSVVGQSVGLRPMTRATPAIEAEVRVPQAVVAEWSRKVLFDFGAASRGYGWVFPKADHLSIGLCSLWTKVDGLRDLARAYVATMLPGVPFELTSLKGHLLPLGGPVGPAHRGEVALVGDAAGLVDPFLGEGIAHAVRSAALAAHHIEAYLDGRAPDLADYSVALAVAYHRDFRWADRIGRVIFRYPRASHRLLMSNRWLASLFVRVFTGELGYRGFLQAAVTSPTRLAAGYLRGA